MKLYLNGKEWQGGLNDIQPQDHRPKFDYVIGVLKGRIKGLQDDPEYWAGVSKTEAKPKISELKQAIKILKEQDGKSEKM